MKRKLTAILLLTVVLFTFFPFSANAVEYNNEIKFTDMETNAECEYILPYKNIEISVKSDRKIGLLGICFYGGSGALRDFKFFADVQSYNEALTVDEQTYKIKIIGWDTLESMSPVIISKEVSREFMPLRPEGLGTKEEPYIIGTPEELAFIFAENTKYYELSNDISLSDVTWYPAEFCGNLDGKKHSVTDVKVADYLVTTGLVSELTPNKSENSTACIKNLTVKTAHSGNLAKISGGIVGKLNSSSAIILNCSTFGNITASQIGGGIVGAINGGQTEGCTSSANVTVLGESEAFAGGISGMSYIGESGDYPRIIDCESSGVVQTCINVDLSEDFKSLSGGITAYNQGYIKDCTCSAKLYSDGKTGGIAAKSDEKIENRCDIVDCIDNSIVINSSSLIFDGGDGSEENPYRISNAKQFNEVRNFLSSSFVQTCDIDLEEIDFSEQNEHKGYVPMGSVDYPYTGTYDGNGFCINNLNINSGYEYTGIFGYSTGTIKNINLKNVNIVVSGDLGDVGNSVAVGSIVGENRGTVTNCSSGGQVSVTSELIGVYNVAVGGIIGRNYGTAEKCSNLCVVGVSQDFCVSSNLAETSSLWLTAGGISGEARGGIIKNCYNLGEINCAVPKSDLDVPFEDYQAGNYENNTGGILPYIEESVGGIAGYANKGKIQNCYTSGKQTAYSVYGAVYIDMGRVAGLCTNAASYILNCYYNSSSVYLINGVPITDNSIVSGLKIKAYGIPKSIAEMRTAEFAEKLGAAFEEDINQENSGYPILKK